MSNAGDIANEWDRELMARVNWRGPTLSRPKNRAKANEVDMKTQNELRSRRRGAGPYLALAVLVAQERSVLPAQQNVLINRADQSRIKGDSDAPIRILEVSDFQCPFCARYNRETLPILDSLYIKTGKVEYVWISFANPSHQFAWPAIEAAFCAGAVGKFWPMHDILFERQGVWSTAEDAFATFVGYAEELGIDAASFGVCLRDDRTAPLQVRDFQSVNRAGISSTPFFIIADSLSIRGAAEAGQFQAVLDSLLAAENE
jgi:protein-disulfide isomerase